MADGHLGAVGVIVPGRALEDTEKGHEIVQIQYQITSVRMRSVETADGQIYQSVWRKPLTCRKSLTDFIT
jgi:hypothetical protein